MRLSVLPSQKVELILIFFTQQSEELVLASEVLGHIPILVMTLIEISFTIVTQFNMRIKLQSNYHTGI